MYAMRDALAKLEYEYSFFATLSPAITETQPNALDRSQPVADAWKTAHEIAPPPARLAVVDAAARNMLEICDATNVAYASDNLSYAMRSACATALRDFNLEYARAVAAVGAYP